MFTIEWLEKFVGLDPSLWKIGLLGGLATGGGLVLFGAWFCLLALAFQKLWNYVFPEALTQRVFNCAELSYRKALAGVGLLYVARLVLLSKQEI